MADDEWPVERQTRLINEGAARIRELGAALLWLRNHYDVGKRAHKQKVLKVIDGILLGPDGVNTWVDLADMAAFRANYLHDEEGEQKP